MIKFLIALVIVLFFLYELFVRFNHEDERSYPPAYAPDNKGYYNIVDPFWIHHETDGYLMPNPLYYDSSKERLNDQGLVLKKQLLKQDPWFASNKRPKD